MRQASIYLLHVSPSSLERPLPAPVVKKPESFCLLCFLLLFPQQWYLLDCKFIPHTSFSLEAQRWCILPVDHLNYFCLELCGEAGEQIKLLVFPVWLREQYLKLHLFPQDENGILKLDIVWRIRMRVLSLWLVRDAPQMPSSLSISSS